MWAEIKRWLELTFTFVFTWLAEIMAAIELEWLQKIFYILSIVLLLIAIIKLLRGKKLGPVEKIVQAPSVVDQAHEAEARAKLVVRMVRKVKRGGKKMFDNLKAFGWFKVIVIIIEFVLVALGVASAFFPELNWIAENIIGLLVAMGITGAAGAWAKGKELGEEAKERQELSLRKKKIKEENKELIRLLEQLERDYAYLIPFRDRLKFGGTLSPEDHAADVTYSTQKKSIVDHFEKNKVELEEIEHKLKGGTTDE